MDKRTASERKKLLNTVDRLLEGPMVFLGFVWLALLVIELVWGLSKPLEYLSITIWVVFIFDFLVKFFLAPGKLRFLKTNWLTATTFLLQNQEITSICLIATAQQEIQRPVMILPMLRSNRADQ